MLSILFIVFLLSCKYVDAYETVLTGVPLISIFLFEENVYLNQGHQYMLKLWGQLGNRWLGNKLGKGWLGNG